jgi:hypothetical protein
LTVPRTSLTRAGSITDVSPKGHDDNTRAVGFSDGDGEEGVEIFVGIIVGEMDPEEGNLVPLGDCNVEGPRLKFVEGLSDMNVDGAWLAENGRQC